MPGVKARGWVLINTEECKGCGLCISVCPGRCLSLSPDFNHQGYHPVRFLGDGCLADSHCFYACPEPGAVAVYRRDADERPAA